MSYSLESLSLSIFQNEFDSDSGLTSQIRISGWLEANIGQLNAKIYTSFDSDLSSPSGVDYVFGHEESVIFSQMYMRDFYAKAARKSLLGQSVSSTSIGASITGMSEWTRIQEGDTIIERQPLIAGGARDTTKVGEKYTDLMDATNENIEKLVAAYNIQGSSPSQVSGKDGD